MPLNITDSSDSHGSAVLWYDHKNILQLTSADKLWPRLWLFNFFFNICEFTQVVLAAVCVFLVHKCAESISCNFTGELLHKSGTARRCFGDIRCPLRDVGQGTYVLRFA